MVVNYITIWFVSLANNNPNMKYCILVHCTDANTSVNNKNRQNYQDEVIDLVKLINKFYNEKFSK